MKKIVLLLILLLSTSCSNKTTTIIENTSNNNDNALIEKLLTIPHYTIEKRYNIDKYEGYFYTDNYFDKENITDEIKIYLAIRSSKEEDWANYKKDQYITVKESTVKNKINEIFGNTTYLNKSIKGDSCVYSNFEYDDKSHIYIEEGPTSTNTLNSYYLTKTINYKIDNEIIIYEKVAYIKEIDNKYYLYKSKDDLNEIAILDNINYDNYLNILNTYKYTFVKDNNNYIFKSIEKTTE